MSYESEIEFTCILKFLYLIKIAKNKLESTITDGDKAIIATIMKTMPTINHKLCLWHLRKNIEKNQGYLNKFKNKKYTKIYTKIVNLL